jgi:hypothetical protein
MGLFDKLFGPPSKDRFAQMFMEAVRAAGERNRISYDRDRFAVVDGGSHVAFLGNVYPEYCSAPKSERGGVFANAVRTWFLNLQDLPQCFEDVHPDLLPVVRCRSYFELTMLHPGVEGKKPLRWPYQVLGEHFGVGLVYDLPTSMRAITQDDLDAWGVTFYEALEAARENLKGLELAFLGPQEGEGVYLSAAKDNYDASRLILPDLVGQFRVKGEPVAMVPNRSNLIVAGTEDLDGLKAMLGFAQDALKEPRPNSGIALRLDGDAWVSWLPDRSHPLYRDFKRMQVQWSGQDYREQKAILDPRHEKSGEDIFVASFSMFEQEATGEIRSYAVWAEGVTHALLPKTDVIAFMAEGKEPVLAEWDRALEHVGDMMQPLDMYPLRYRVRAFPDADQLKAIGRVTL